MNDFVVQRSCLVLTTCFSDSGLLLPFTISMPIRQFRPRQRGDEQLTQLPS
jgi:hypothetical protein